MIPEAPVIQFRYEATPVDCESVRTIVTQTGFFNEAEIAIAVELVEERLVKGAASGYEFVLAEQAGEVVGYTCYGEIAGSVGSYDLYWIAVSPATQRQGLGKRLLQETERLIAAAAGRHIYAETSSREQYQSTHQFYERSGYHRAAVLDDFYAPGDGKVFYLKKLT